jgi:hypothetical protein
MTPKEKSKNLVDSYRIILMNEDTECGNEILCTLIAKKCALIAIDEMIVQNGELYLNSLGDKTIQFYAEKNGYLFEVKQEIQLL